MIIKGLGIVSWIELFIFVMFITLLVWTFSADLHFFFDHMAIFKEIEDDKRLVLCKRSSSKYASNILKQFYHYTRVVVYNVFACTTIADGKLN